MSITDVNDNPPQFSASAYSFLISENLSSGTEVGTFQVVDRDSGAAAEYTFTLVGMNSGRFSVEIVSVTQMSSASSQPPVVTTARIVTNQPLDREDVGLYQFTVIAQDRTSSPLTGSTPLMITVEDVNDNSPVFPNSLYSFNISEGTSILLVGEFSVS